MASKGFASRLFETDKYLIDRILSYQDKYAAEILVERYYKSVYKEIYIRTSDEELSLDLTQETFISVLKALSSFDSKKAAFKTWILKIAQNKVIDYRRSRHHHEALVTETIETYDTDDGRNMEENVINKLTKERIEEVLQQEDENARQIFIMKAQQGYTFSEISEITGTAQSTVKNRYYSMVKKMRKELQGYE